MAIEIEPFFNRKHNVVPDAVMTLRTSSQVLYNVGSYHLKKNKKKKPYPLNTNDVI